MLSRNRVKRTGLILYRLLFLAAVFLLYPAATVLALDTPGKAGMPSASEPSITVPVRQDDIQTDAQMTVQEMTVQQVTSQAEEEQSNEQTPSVSVPIIMYHSIFGCGKDALSNPKAFEEDLKYLQEQGYHSVFFSDLINYVYDGTPLPDKPVILTFDDGYYNNYSAGLPLLEKYDMKVVISVIGVYSEIWSGEEVFDNQNAHVSWVQIREMADSGYVEIANHTWDLHKKANGRYGCAIKRGEDKESYRKLLSEDVGKLQQNLSEFCGLTPTVFTYPYGNMCPEAVDVLKDMGFKITVGCSSGMNVLTQGDADCLYELHRYNRTSGKPVKAILESLNKSKGVLQTVLEYFST